MRIEVDCKFGKLVRCIGGGRRLSPCAALAFCILLVLSVARTGAQVFPPQGDDTTPSMGVFRLIIDPLFRPLFAPTGPPTSYPGYTGYHSSDGHLTSPVLIDNSTIIGRSNPHPRFYSFPQPLGAGSWDIINGYGDYAAIPFLWFAAPAGDDEVLTEIKTFILETPGNATGEQGCTNSLVPVAPPGYQMVKAGTFAGISPRSLGLVQAEPSPSPPDFPARSFFDIFVQVNLPPLAGTESSVAFPATGLVASNSVPLIVTNLDLTSFPPEVIYIHGGTTNAVDLWFTTDNPPYWAAGDHFGTIVLAGHGTFTNDCSQEAALTGAVLGTPSDPMPEPPTAWLEPTSLFPSPGTSYASLLTDTNPPGGSDILTFTIAGEGSIYLQNFVLNNFSNSVTPPPYFGTNYYDPTNIIFSSFQFSIDQANWFPATGTGQISITISNTSPQGSSMNTFLTQITRLSLSGVSQLGNFMLRQDTAFPSIGRHTIQPNPRGYRVSSYFDAFIDLSTDGGLTWIPANRSTRVSSSAPAAAPGTLFVSKLTTGPGYLLRWLGPFTVQSSSNVNGPFADISGSTGGALNNSWTVSLGPKQQFFRLRQ